MIYRGNNLREISFPLGGIGTGSIGLAGNGRLIDFEIFNRPNKGGENGYSAFSVRAISPDGTVNARALRGDELKDFIGPFQGANFRGYGHGPNREAMATLLHFRDVTFDGRFPVAELKFRDPAFPLEICMTAFNPLIPHHADDSSIPAAFFRLTVNNPTGTEYCFDSVLSFRNPYAVSRNMPVENDGVPCIKMMNAGAGTEEIPYGDISVACSDRMAKRQTYWYRGTWQDGIDTFWRAFSSGMDLSERSYDADGVRDHCAISSGFRLSPGESRSVDYAVAWNVPNNHYHLRVFSDADGNEITWKNYYTKLFADSAASASYAIKEFDRLLSETLRFRDALLDSTIDETVLDAAASNIAVLKSSSIYRLTDGSFYGFEGTHERAGSCSGTCQHVWNYAYALCFLFPELERSIRDLELKYSMDAEGKIKFRLLLPLGRKEIGDEVNGIHARPCLDGQMGTILKIYRDWKLTGDDEWLKNNFEKVMRLMEYAWNRKNPAEWDLDKDGMLEGCQHNTLDIQLFGPSSWLQGFYLGALKATSEMAEHLGYADKAKEYRDIYENGRRLSNEQLFNGSYFIQKIDFTDKSITDHFNCSPNYWHGEAGEIKYQIAEGCELDQLCGQWHADISGLGSIFDEDKVRTALSSMMKYNFKTSVRELDNPWRAFALNDESATIMCTWPEGVKKPFIPVSYYSECWTGTEYEFAGLLAKHGYVKDAIKVVHAARSRYNGTNRNPFSEIECGSNYARSMASFALIPLFSGFSFDMPRLTIGFSPVTKDLPFRSFWAVGGAWGTVNIEKESCEIRVLDGSLSLEHLCLPFLKTVSKVTADGRDLDYSFSDGFISFPKATASESFGIYG